MKLRKILGKLISQKYKTLSSNKLYELFDFDNKSLPNITKINKTAYTFEYKLNGQITDVYVDFVKVQPDTIKLSPLLSNATDIYNVAYAISDNIETKQYAKTTLTDIGSIMFVVSEIVKKFVDDLNPEILTFFATSKDDTERGERQKMMMYREIATKYKPIGYIMENVMSSDGQRGFMLFNSDSFHKKVK